MKTNHQRNFVAKDDRPIGGDATNGHRGIARQKAGFKKYIRTRRRFKENTELKKCISNHLDKND